MQEPTRPDYGEGRSGGNGMSEQIPSDLPGYWRRHAGKKGTMRNTGSSSGDRGFGSTGNSREIGRAVWDGGEARSTDEAG